MWVYRHAKKREGFCGEENFGCQFGRVLNYKTTGCVVGNTLDLEPGDLGLVPVQKLIDYVTLDKSFCFSEPLLSHL